MAQHALTPFLCCGHIQKLNPQPAPIKTLVKKENQWFDVGIVKVTNMVVTHFFIPEEDSQVEVRLKAGFMPFYGFEIRVQCSTNDVCVVG